MLRLHNPSASNTFKIPTPSQKISRLYPSDTTPYVIEAPDTGKKVWVSPSFLSDDQIETLTSICKTLLLEKRSCQLIKEDKDKSSILQDMLKDLNIPLKLEYTDFVSVSYNNTYIPIHTDFQHICPFTHKVLIYLSQTPENTGGTIFYTEDEVPFVTTPNYAGSVVIFDSTLKHASQPFPPDYVKISIGIRAREVV